MAPSRTGGDRAVQFPILSRRVLLAGACLPWASRIAAADKPVGLRTDLGVWTDDWDGLLHRRVIRMLVPYSRTLFFQDRGTLYGVSVDAAQLLEGWINKTYKTGKRPLVVALIPTTRDKLFTELLAGRGDIAAGDITITPERAKLVSFTVPTVPNVSEVLVTRADAPRVADASGLSGMEVAVREGTSFYESLQSLNKSLADAGKPLVKLSLIPPALETEDMMEMVAAGLLPAIVADDWIANLWTTLIPGLTVQKQVVLRSGGDIGWAVRPDNPKLLEVLNTAITQVGGKAVQLSNRTKIYLRKLKQIHGATSRADVQRFEALKAMFAKYGDKYGFDDLLLQAQSYQESRLDQNAHSQVGAVGLMQLMPATGASMKVGDIHQPDPNVHAGAQYMRSLIDRYFPDAKFDTQNRTLFAFASYNAGPGAIARMRKIAVQEHLDPNLWFDNVERVTAAHIGQEPVRYVRNIYKYYIAYRLLEERRASIDAVQKTPKTN